jgi:hypothetical protein
MKELTLRELERNFRETPEGIKRGKNNAKSIAAIGSQDTNYELVLQNRRRHYSSGIHETAKPSENYFLVSDAMKTSKAKHAKVSSGKKRDYPYATICVSYKLRDSQLYWFGKPLAEYVGAFYAGHITEKELLWIVNWINKSAPIERKDEKDVRPGIRHKNSRGYSRSSAPRE